MNCNACGTEVTNPAAVFCPNCGAKLDAAPADQAAPEATAAAPAVPEAPIAPPEPPPVDPRQTALFNEDWAPIVKVGDWIGSLLILALVPLALTIIAGLVGQLMPGGVLTVVLNILALVSGLAITLWFAFGKRFNPSKRNFFKAYLILTVIMIVLAIVLTVVIFKTLVTSSDFMDILTTMPL